MLDASVALAWVLEDESSDFSNQLLLKMKTMEKGSVICPRMTLIEVANALWVAENRKRVPQGKGSLLVELFTHLGIIFVESTESMIFEAHKLAINYQLSVYDCIYLVLAQKNQIPIATIDQRMIKVANQLSVECL